MSARPTLRVALAVLAALATCVAFLAAPTTAIGSEPEIAWGVRPADGAHGTARDNFRHVARAGTILEDALIVTNHGSGALSLSLYGADGTLVDDHVELAPMGAAATGLGAWLDVPPGVEIAPGEAAEVPFTLAVPADAVPGQHAGALVTSSLVDPGAGLAVDRRLAASIVVTVTPPDPDPVPDTAAPGDGTPSSAGSPNLPPRAALLALAALALVAVAVWAVVLQGRATR